MPINTGRRNKGNRKSPLDHGSNDCYGPDPLMSAEISR